jgi:peptidoglycan/xylan/chitin deacetylase (PgdA/CDA1 family)
MNAYFIKTPRIIMRIFRNYTWRFFTSKKEIYLTFDDGPIPLVTEFVLETLKKQQVKATFFCVGENVKKHPEIYNRIIKEGHQTGNHTYNHLNGWKCNTEDYINNIVKCEELTNTKLFRPPYGKIKKSQARQLQKNGFKIIMWRLLSGDLDKNISAKTCCQNVINNAQNGDIIVFHDNIKSHEKLIKMLEKLIISLKDKGFVFKTIKH